MIILINASNLSGGGGVQVADSICRYLKDYKQHRFVVVLSTALDDTAKAISEYDNVTVIKYSYPARDWKSFITLRNEFLDGVVKDYSVECVYTVFGPMKWKPRCPHVCGFALAHVVMPESPYFKRMSFWERLKWRVQIFIWELIFRRSSRIFITENPLITERLKKKFKGSQVYTITNNYNQLFDRPECQQECPLPLFEGKTVLSIGTNYPHKNLSITIDIARILRRDYPDLKFRFVLTIEEHEFPILEDSIRDCFVFLGKVSIAECPSLYRQADVAFVPTLLECFTAAYPEAMRMGVPIVTTDLEFARGLCKEAALYYEPTNTADAAKKILKVLNNEFLKDELISSGHEVLKSFDSAQLRVERSLFICQTKCNS